MKSAQLSSPEIQMFDVLTGDFLEKFVNRSFLNTAQIFWIRTFWTGS